VNFCLPRHLIFLGWSILPIAKEYGLAKYLELKLVADLPQLKWERDNIIVGGDINRNSL